MSATTITTREQQVAHDQATAAAYADVTAAEAKRAGALAEVHRAAGDRKVWYGRRQMWAMTSTEAEVALRDKVAAGNPDRPWQATADENTLARFDAAGTAVAAALEALHALNELYTGWTRFFEVTSSNGHIHSSMGCSSCYPTTQFGWHPQLSGLTEVEAVAQLGPILCSVCFPSAPLDWRRDRKDVRAEADAATGLYCAGQGSYASDIRWLNSPHGVCGTCGRRQSVTSTGKVRKHKKPE